MRAKFISYHLPNKINRLVFTFATPFVIQARLIRGASFVHETLSPYKNLEELWDEEI